MASSAVNRPTDVKFKEQDVNNKLQLYGIYSAFANGKAPSNKQIDVALNSALESKALTSPPQKLSAEGKQLVTDLREVIEEAKLLLLSKNSGNLLQEFIWETQQISGGDAKLPNAPVNKETAKQHGNEALEGLRTLGTLVISNGQFRKLLSDAAILLRSIAGDAATNAAGKVQPSDEQLRQIDAPAEDNTWHDVPDVSRDALKSKIPFGKKDAKDVATEASAAAHPEGSTDPADTAALAAREQQEGVPSSVNATAGANAAAGVVSDKINEQTPEAKSKVKEYNARTQNYLKGKMPKERREQTIWRLKKMIVEIQGHADYQRAVETLLTLAETYGGHSKNLASQGQGTIKDFYSTSQPALTKFKTLIERFANGTSSDDFFDSLNQIYRDADQDPELKGWFKSIDAYIRRCLQEQGYVMQPHSTDEFNTLYDKGKYLLRDKYRTHTDRILDEIKFFGNQFEEDPQNKAFGQAVQKLFLDLGNDETGKAVFKPHLLKDVTEVILPQVLETVHYLPIPRIEYSDPQVDLIIENLIIESDNLAPNIFEFGSDNYWKWGRKAGNKSSNKNKVLLAVSGVQMDLRDVSFYVNRKQGFPSIKDQGLCDIFMGGEGFSFKIQMETADNSQKAHFFTITDVKVGVKNFNIKLKQSKHKFLFAIAKPLIIRAMRPALQKALEQAIKQKARELDAIAYEIHREVQKAKAEAEANPDPENIKNIYQRYWTAANQRFTQAKQKADKVQESLDNKKFNMAMTKQDSIFPDISLSSGISTKATEYKELAAKGDRWESPVFGIGSAKESSSIPSAPEVTRKSHASPLNGVNGTNGTSGITNNGLTNNGLGTNGLTKGVNGTNGTHTQGFGQQVDRAFEPVNV
jgi:hypothetical protein